MKKIPEASESLELSKEQLAAYARKSGYSDLNFLASKRIGYRNDGQTEVYLTLGYDAGSDEYIVGKALVNHYRYTNRETTIDFEPSPEFSSADRAEAYDAYHTLASGGKLAEGKYAAGGRAPQDEYDDVIEDVLNGWDIADTPQDGMTLPADALEQIEAALKAYDPSLEQTGVQDIIETYFEHSVARAGVPGDEATVGDIEDEAFELGMDGFPDEDVQHRLSQKHGLSRGEVSNILAYESKSSVKSILREAAKPVQQDKLGSWYRQSFKESYGNNGYEPVDLDLEEGSSKPGTPVLKEAVRSLTNKRGYTGLAYREVWQSFRDDMFKAIRDVVAKYNMGNSNPATSVDKADFDAVVDWMDSHGYWDDPDFEG